VSFSILNSNGLSIASFATLRQLMSPKGIHVVQDTEFCNISPSTIYGAFSVVIVTGNRHPVITEEAMAPIYFLSQWVNMSMSRRYTMNGWYTKLWVVYFLFLQGVRGWISLLLFESFHSKWTLLPDQVRVNLFLNSNLCFNLYCCGPIRSQVHSSFWCIFAMVAVYDSMGLFCSAFLPSARCGEFMPLISIIYCM